MRSVCPRAAAVNGNRCAVAQGGAMSLSRRELFRYGAAATLAASAVPAGTASAVEVSTPAEGTAAHIVAAYRELQIGRGRHSMHRDQALAALDQVAESYDAAMTVTGDQL